MIWSTHNYRLGQTSWKWLPYSVIYIRIYVYETYVRVTETLDNIRNGDKATHPYGAGRTVHTYTYTPL